MSLVRRAGYAEKSTALNCIDYRQHATDFQQHCNSNLPVDSATQLYEPGAYTGVHPVAAAASLYSRNLDYTIALHCYARSHGDLQVSPSQVHRLHGAKCTAQGGVRLCKGQNMSTSKPAIQQQQEAGDGKACGLFVSEILNIPARPAAHNCCRLRPA